MPSPIFSNVQIIQRCHQMLTEIEESVGEVLPDELSTYVTLTWGNIMRGLNRGNPIPSSAELPRGDPNLQLERRVRLAMALYLPELQETVDEIAHSAQSLLGAGASNASTEPPIISSRGPIIDAQTLQKAKRLATSSAESSRTKTPRVSSSILGLPSPSVSSTRDTMDTGSRRQNLNSPGEISRSKAPVVSTPLSNVNDNSGVSSVAGKESSIDPGPSKRSKVADLTEERSYPCITCLNGAMTGNLNPVGRQQERGCWDHSLGQRCARCWQVSRGCHPVPAIAREHARNLLKALLLSPAISESTILHLRSSVRNAMPVHFIRAGSKGGFINQSPSVAEPSNASNSHLPPTRLPYESFLPQAKDGLLGTLRHYNNNVSRPNPLSQPSHDPLPAGSVAEAQEQGQNISPRAGPSGSKVPTAITSSLDRSYSVSAYTPSSVAYDATADLPRVDESWYATWESILPNCPVLGFGTKNELLSFLAEVTMFNAFKEWLDDKPIEGHPPKGSILLRAAEDELLEPTPKFTQYPIDKTGWDYLDHKLWYIIQVVRYGRSPDGIWKTMTEIDIPAMAHAALALLSFMQLHWRRHKYSKSDEIYNSIVSLYNGNVDIDSMEAYLSSGNNNKHTAENANMDKNRALQQRKGDNSEGDDEYNEDGSEDEDDEPLYNRFLAR